MIQLEFETIKPATRISIIYGYVVIPVFNYSGIIWKGASEAITQFNYSATKNFILRNIPNKPFGVNFCPVIRYRVGNTVYRYKLWSAVGERLQVENYNGQIIKKNFVIEIWNVETSSSVSNLAELNFLLSIRKVPTDWVTSAASNYQDASYTQVYPVSESASMPSAPPATGLAYRYKADLGVVLSGSDVVSIADQSGNNRNLDTPSNPAPTVVSAGFGNKNGGLGSPYFRLAATTRHIYGTFGSAFSIKHGFILLRNVSWSANRPIFIGGGCLIAQNGTSGQIRFTSGITVVTVDAAVGVDYLVEYFLDYNGSNYDLKINVYDLFGDLKFSAVGGSPVANPSTSNQISIGINPGTSADCNIAEAFGYTEKLSVTDKTNVINYIVNAYNDGALLVDYVASDGIPWLDNQ